MNWVGFLFVATLLTACASAPVVTKALPPPELLYACPFPEDELGTNGGLARTIQRLKLALQGCNDDKEALREWARP